jgi:hypothetical protein
MNPSHAFRSHLMQQFASAARSQSRPPLAMVPWIPVADLKLNREEKLENNEPVVSSESSMASRNHCRRGPSSSRSWAATSSASRCVVARGTGMTIISSIRARSSLAHNEEDTQELENEARTTAGVSDGLKKDAAMMASSKETASLARHFQTLIQTRRTTSHFATLGDNDNTAATFTTAFDNSSSLAAATFWKEALHRAVECGRRAPNHKRTEPFSFKRVISPSAATDRLAEIAYYCALQKPNATEISAEKKRAKWQQIPAFLITMVTAKERLYPEDLDTGLYHQLPFVPLQTERALEDVS